MKQSVGKGKSAGKQGQKKTGQSGTQQVNEEFEKAKAIQRSKTKFSKAIELLKDK